MQTGVSSAYLFRLVGVGGEGEELHVFFFPGKVERIDEGIREGATEMMIGRTH